MSTVNILKGLIGKQDFNIGVGSFSRLKSNGTSQTMDRLGHHTFAKAFSVMDYGAVGDGVIDDTDAIQETIDAAAENRTTDSWSLEELRQVYVPCAERGYLIKGHLIVPEGVEIIGENIYGSRLFLHANGWTTDNAKIRDANYDGVTASKNFGFRNICFCMDFNDPSTAAALSDVAMVELRKVTEAHFINCRFINHTYPAQFAPYSISAASYDADGVTSIKLKEGVGINIDDCGFDRGNTHIHAVRVTNNGIAWSRIHNCYFYNSSNYALRMGVQCELNSVTGNIFDLPAARGNAGRGIWIENDSTSPSENNTFNGNVVRAVNEALICDGNSNQFVGGQYRSTTSGKTPVTITGDMNLFIAKTRSTGTTYEINVSGESNLIIPSPHKENSNAYGESGGANAAVGNIVLFQDRIHAAGKQFIKTKTLTLTSASTWYDLANLYVPQTFTALKVKLSVSGNVAGGIGLRQVEYSFFVQRAGGSVTSQEIYAETQEFGAGSGRALEIQATDVDADNIKFQVQRLVGSSTNVSAVIEVTLQAQPSRQYSFYLTDLTI